MHLATHREPCANTAALRAFESQPLVLDFVECTGCFIEIEQHFADEDGLTTPDGDYLCTGCAKLHICDVCGEYTWAGADELGPAVRFRDPLVNGKLVPAHGNCAAAHLANVWVGDSYLDADLLTPELLDQAVAQFHEEYA